MTARRPKLKLISEVAGVSRATVDRVVNNRPGVQLHTRQHVLAVMAELSGSSAVAEQLSEAPDVRLDFIIPDNRNAFMADLIAQLESHAGTRRDVMLTVHRLDGIGEAEMIATLDRLYGTSQAVGLIGLDSQKVREAVRKLSRIGIPVVTLASDIRNARRMAYVGVDNHAAGRLAGYLAGRLTGAKGGKLALILGSRAYRGHEEREMGFRGVLREKFAGYQIVAEHEIHEDIQSARDEVRRLLDLHDDLDAIYCIGAGQPGVARALIESGRSDRVVFIGHGLSDDTRKLLVDGVMDVVIDDNAAAQAAAAVDGLVAAVRNRAAAPFSTPEIRAIFSENIPAEQ